MKIKLKFKVFLWKKSKLGVYFQKNVKIKYYELFELFMFINKTKTFKTMIKLLLLIYCEENK